MAEKLRFKEQEMVHLRGMSGSHTQGVVITFDKKQTRVNLMLRNEDRIGFVSLSWTGEEYVSLPSQRPVTVEKQLFAKARLKKLKSDDGIIELLEETAYVGKEYLLDLNSISDRNWGHNDHPGKSWTRQTALVKDAGRDDDDLAPMPIEFFDIEAN